MEAHSFPDHSRAVARFREIHACPYVKAERAVLGIDHARVGDILAERWHLPPAICNAIAAHHTHKSTSAPALDSLERVVSLANALAHCRNDHEEPETRQQCSSRLPWEKANLVGTDGEKVLAAIERELKFLCGMLIDNASSER